MPGRAGTVLSNLNGLPHPPHEASLQIDLQSEVATCMLTAVSLSQRPVQASRSGGPRRLKAVQYQLWTGQGRNPVSGPFPTASMGNASPRSRPAKVAMLSPDAHALSVASEGRGLEARNRFSSLCSSSQFDGTSRSLGTCENLSGGPRKRAPTVSHLSPPSTGCF